MIVAVALLVMTIANHSNAQESALCPRTFPPSPSTAAGLYSAIVGPQGQQIIRRFYPFANGTIGVSSRNICYRDEHYFRIDFDGMDEAATAAVTSQLQQMIAESTLGEALTQGDTSVDKVLLGPAEQMVRADKAGYLNLGDALTLKQASDDQISGSISLIELPTEFGHSRSINLYIDIGPDPAHFE
ncbi:MAG: hypothetical protein II007_00645 [Gammaproteobacteria bacterium]|nr:hypothetical protein [Gammaproteobacteria bacterium]